MCSLEIVSQLVIIEDQVFQKFKALSIELERVDQSPESILGIKVQDQVLILFLEDLSKLLRFFRLDCMLAVARNLSLVSSRWLSRGYLR